MNLQGKPGELRFCVEIKRAETGKVETYELIGHIQPEETKDDHGSHPLDSSPQRSD